MSWVLKGTGDLCERVRGRRGAGTEASVQLDGGRSSHKGRERVEASVNQDPVEQGNRKNLILWARV